MAKKNGFGKFLMFCTVVGAACAGAYYYMNKQDKELADDFDDDFDDFDDFSDDDDNKDSRKYVNLGHEQEDGSKEDVSDSSKNEDVSDASKNDAASSPKTTTEEFFDDTK